MNKPKRNTPQRNIENVKEVFEKGVVKPVKGFGKILQLLDKIGKFIKRKK